MIKQDGEEFRNLLDELYEDCCQLFIMMTTSHPIGDSFSQQTYSLFFVKDLKPKSAVELFNMQCGEISDDEIVKFVLADKNYPYGELLLDYKDREVDLSDPDEEEKIQ